MSSSNIQTTLNFTSPSTLNIAQLPSVFELLAEERLSELINPCLQRIIKFSYENFPTLNIIRSLYKYKDEFVLLVEGVVQWLYLNSYSALVGEHFYGLRRSANNRLRSLIFSTFLPYVKRKLDTLYEEVRANNNSNRSQRNYIILKVLPKIQTFIEGINWLYRIGYAFGKMEYYSPQLQLAGVKLVYAKEPSPVNPPTNLFSHLFYLIGQILSSGLFLIQFVDWLNNTNGSKQKSYNKNSRVPPLPKNVRSLLNINKQQCPLCQKPCVIPTAVIISGYVYCNICINNYIDQHHRCPATNRPITKEDLKIVY